MEQKIILTADDFGRSPERNNAIDVAFKQGLIKSAGLMVNTKYVEQAVAMAVKGNYIEHLHCHFNLRGGKVGGYSIPLSDKIKKCNAFCHNDVFSESRWSYVNLFIAHIVYDELEKQYLMFKKITANNGNDKHVDFHTWGNHKIPVAIALSQLIKKYGIKSFRRSALHHASKGFCYKLLSNISNSLCDGPNCLMDIPSSRIDYLLHNNISSDLIEVYVHPDYQEDCLVDNSKPIYSKVIRPLDEQVRLLEERLRGEFISWEDLV